MNYTVAEKPVFYNTIDLDFVNHEQAREICAKIAVHKCCLKLNLKPSSFKGYHVMMLCSRDCDLCRFVFDGNKRYACDLKRKKQYRNILFDEKVQMKLNADYGWDDRYDSYR